MSGPITDRIDIVRHLSPVVTIGGGTVLDIAAPRRAGLERMRILESAPTADRIALLVSEARYGMGMPELVARTGLLEADIRKAAGAAPVCGSTMTNPGTGTHQQWQTERDALLTLEC